MYEIEIKLDGITFDLEVYYETASQSLEDPDKGLFVLESVKYNDQDFSELLREEIINELGALAFEKIVG